ncbi:Hachiman antiphage defense system protein HamA [Flavobacterium sp.]|uniref:Hachiman antiphage defense system protein HamA n=1 Tax=Flavobacterium sp. TaxID=239 RepID=UPI0035B176EE
MSIDWEKKIKIDTEWSDRQLTHHFTNKNAKITVRAFTPKVSGTTFSCDALIEELGYFLPDYVHTDISKKNKLKSLTSQFGKTTAEKRFDTALYKEALSFFGKKDPTTDGKYGELLLFALTESILKSKMIAHKIEGLSNAKDQIKGGDGIFLGNYEIEEGQFEPAIFIGESKIMQGFSDCIDDALGSINRFHAPDTKAEFNSMEFIVANKTIFIDDSDIDYDKIYEMLTPGSQAFQNQILVHPILIMYNTSHIENFEKKATTKAHLEFLIKTHLESKKDKLVEKINEKLKTFSQIEKVYVDFFCFPFNNINNFRNGMYFNIHKVPYSK